MVISSVKVPKKTLRSRKWMLRNDSTSVGKLLKSPETPSSCKLSDDGDSDLGSDIDHEPRRLILSEPQSGVVNNHKIVKTFCPDCYCKSFPVVPSMGRPRDSCCCQKQTQTLNRSRIQSAPTFLNKTPTCPKERFERAGRFTKRREYYEDMTKDYFVKMRQRLDALEEELRREQEEIYKKQKDYHSCLELGQKDTPKKYCPKCCPFKEDDRIKDLMRFRKSHYFACHASTTSLGTSASKSNIGKLHCTDKCIHRCRLNDQMKLEPEKCDEYGTSRCSNCEGPISHEALSFSPTINSRSTVFAQGSSFFDDMNLLSLDDDDKELESKSDGRDLVDKMILTTHKNEKLEVTLPPNFLKEAQKPLSMVTTTKNFKNFKMPVPANSMALRFQKGVINKSINPKNSPMLGGNSCWS